MCEPVDKLSLSFILNPSLSSSPPSLLPPSTPPCYMDVEEDNDLEIDETIEEEEEKGSLAPPPAANPPTPQWQSCRPSFSLPPFAYLSQQPQQRPATFPVRRESPPSQMGGLPPNIAFFQPRSNILNHNHNYLNTHNTHNTHIPSTAPIDFSQNDSNPSHPPNPPTNHNTSVFMEEDEEDPHSRAKRAHTAPAEITNRNYKAKKFTSANGLACKRQPPRKISPEQLEYLEKAFEEDRMPDTSTKMRISQQLNLSPQQVKIWFQNKRARMRRLEKAMNPNEEDSHAGGITFHFFESHDFLHEY